MCRLPLTTTLRSLLPLQFVPSMPNFPQTSIFKVYYNFNYATPTPLIKTNTNAFISKLQNNLTALLNYHLTLPLYNLPSNNNKNTYTLLHETPVYSAIQKCSKAHF